MTWCDSPLIARERGCDRGLLDADAMPACVGSMSSELVMGLQCRDAMGAGVAAGGADVAGAALSYDMYEHVQYIVLYILLQRHLYSIYHVT